MDTQKIFLLIAIFLTVLLLWNKWEVEQTVDENGNIINQTSIVSDTPEQSEDVPSATVNVEQASTPSMDVSLPQGPYTTVTTDLLTVEISHKGGTIQSAYLNKYPNELGSEDKLQLLSNLPGATFHAQSGLLPDKEMPTHNDNYSSSQSSYALGNASELTVPLTWTGANGVIVTKNFHFKPDSYIVEIDYEVQNNSDGAINVGSYTQLSRSMMPSTSGFMSQNYTGGAIYINNEDNEGVFEKIDFEDFDSEPKTSSIGGWTSIIQHYFFTAWIPSANDRHSFSTRTRQDRHLLATVSPNVVIAPGEQTTLASNQLYVGPKEHMRLEELAPGLDKTVDYGVLYIVAKPLSEFLHWINSFIGSWALSIVAVTFLIKLAFYKLSEKSYRSMAGMKKLAPRLQKIKETYGDDKQKVGKKTMELYKQEKVNPAAGCLPILVQIPVFISMYWVLQEMVELRHTAFLYLPDLSSKDPFFILPLIMGASMWFQQRLNPPPADPMQAKIMMMLPIIFTVFFLWFPAGLVLYWVTNNLLSIGQQMFINKRINKT